MRPTTRLFALTSHYRIMSSSSSTNTTPYAIVAGVGPGTGATVARKFAQKYPVALLARNPANYESAVHDIESAGGRAIGISTDVSSPESVDDAVKKIKAEFGAETRCAAAVFNVGGRFVRKPFLELTQEEFEAGWEANGWLSTSLLSLLVSSHICCELLD
ncbi:MAG: hypothetical protein Q9220_001712 [cf. Caloplaca sp. 1 TL-2023]